jgi:hypothetical protein
VPRHRHLRGGGEDAQPEIGLELLGRQDECRLGEIHLVGDRLHRRQRQASGVEKHSELIAAEQTIGEDVVVKVPV